METAAYDPPQMIPASRPRVPLWVLIGTFILLAVNVVLQRPGGRPPTEVSDLESGKLVEPPGISVEVAIGKVAVAKKGETWMGVDVGEIAFANLAQFLGQTGFAQDQFRSAVVAAKVGQFDAMRSTLAGLDTTIDPQSPLVTDIETLRALFPTEGNPVEPSAKDRDGLIKRHGWFGKVLFDDGAPGGVIDKAKVEGATFMRVVIRFALLEYALFFGGLSMLIVIGIMAGSRTLRVWPTPWRTAPDTSDGRATLRMWVETVAMFLAGFLAMKMGVLLIHTYGNLGSNIVWVPLLAPWLLVPLIVWPLWRGMSWRQFSAESGWHTGRGLFREVLTGVVSYVAIVPIVVIVALIMVLIITAVSFAFGMKPPAPPAADKVFDLASGTGIELIATFMLVTVWAPLVEETVFRGALYRSLRSRLHFLLAAFLSAFAFAIMHGYAAALQLVAVGTLGFCFALVREWRGSLIPTMTAHFLQNAIVFTVLSMLVPIMQG